MTITAIVVGNGPISDEQRSRIENIKFKNPYQIRVYRFNDFYNKNYRDGESVDVHVVRKTLRGCFDIASSLIGKTPEPFIIENIVRKINFSENKSYRNMNISTGTILLGMLDKDPNIDRIEIYGMNHKFPPRKNSDWTRFFVPNHSERESTILQERCLKCVFYPTPTDNYI